MSVEEPNAYRYTGPNHAESYFLRAVDPTRPRAVWLKSTVLAPREGPPVAEAWCIFFDGEENRRWARRLTIPLAQARFQTLPDNGADLSVGPTSARFGATGEGRGTMEGMSWDLRWHAPSAPAAQAPLSLYPHPLLYRAPLPRIKLHTPFPSLVFDGQLEVFGEKVDVRGWRGSQGHNYGTQNPYEYVWGQCVFPAAGSEPETVMEGASFRLKLGAVVTPRFSVLVVRHGAKEYRFDRIIDLWRQDVSFEKWRWTARFASRRATGSVTFERQGRPMVCLGYGNPSAPMSYCFNSKLAHVWLSVQEKDGHGFSLESPHGGALEFLLSSPDPDFPDVV